MQYTVKKVFAVVQIDEEDIDHNDHHEMIHGIFDKKSQADCIAKFLNNKEKNWLINSDRKIIKNGGQ